jgi:hypothetical protein
MSSTTVPARKAKVPRKVPVQTEGIFGRDWESTKVSILRRLGKELQVESASSTTPAVRSPASRGEACLFSPMYLWFGVLTL